MAYTAKQKSTIEYLINEGKSIHKRLEHPEYGEKEILTKRLAVIKKQLKTALNAEAMYRAHLRVAEEHLNAAEALKNEWIAQN